MVLYADLNCPYSYALCERLRLIGVGPVWNGVEHDPELPIPARPPADAIGFEREFGAVRDLAPEVPLNQPSILPNSRRALAAIAAAEALDPDRAADFRWRLFRALWVNGRDISDLAVLEDVARASLLPAGIALRNSDCADARRYAPNVTPIPAIVRKDGEVLHGLVDLERLRLFLAPLSSDGDLSRR